MKQHTSAFKEEIKKLGRQITDIITFGNTTLQEELYSVSIVTQANLLKSVMKQLIVESTVAIPNDTVINYQLGVLVNENYEYIDYGNYVVTKVERQEDTNKYLITCYDKMIYAMKKNEQLPIVYPISIKNYLIAVATKIGLQVKNTTFMNEDLQIASELYYGLEYTYRDILDEIAQATGSIIVINEDDELEVKYPNDTEDVIDGEFLKDTNVKIGEKYGPINSIVLSRAGESDNVYLRDEESVTQNGLCEIKIVDNQIMNFNDRSDYLEGILAALDGLEYYINDFPSTGVLYYDIYDKYTILRGQQEYNCLVLNDEINRTQGLEELIHTDMPEQSETDYTKADKTDRRINETYIIVDKQNQTIESVVSNVSTQNQKISRIEQTVDELNSKISDIADITTSQETLTGTLQFTGINQSEPIHIEVRATGENISYLYPFNLLYPANNLYIKLRTIRFTNTTTSEVFDYELPDDILYYDNDNYDSFVLDYDSQTVYINKKCQYNTSTGAVELLATPRTDEYSFPTIELTDGDYTVSVLKYDNTPYGCYLFVRLMAQNIYTTQFATKAELNSSISQTATSITLSVDQKLSNYSTTTQMNAAITVKANEINSVVSTKVGKSEIISRINQSSEAITIDANKISLAGKTIDLTGDSIQINSTNFKVDTDGNIRCSNATISGNITATSGKIAGYTIDGNVLVGNNVGMSGKSGEDWAFWAGSNTSGSAPFRVGHNGALTATNATISGNISSTSGEIGGFSIGGSNLHAGSGSNYISLNSNPSTNSAIWAGNEDAGQAPFRVTKAGRLTATDANITGTITATNGRFENCTITNSCSVPASTVSGTLATSTIPNISASKITSGTMSGDRIYGGTIGGSEINAVAVATDILHLNNPYYSIEIGNNVSSRTGTDYVVYNDGETGWTRLTFTCGILTNIQHNW